MKVAVVEGCREATFNIGTSELKQAYAAAKKSKDGVVTLRVKDAKIGNVVELMLPGGVVVDVTDYEAW